MTKLTHQTMAIMAAYALNFPIPALITVWIGSIFPDLIDARQAQRAIFFKRKKFNQVHRKSSHWFGWWLGLWLISMSGLLGNLPDTLLRGLSFGALSHIVLDMCTTRGVPLLPFGGSPFSLKICSTGGITEYLILLICIGLFGRHYFPELMTLMR